MRLSLATWVLIAAGVLVTLGFQVHADQGYAGLIIDGSWVFTGWTLLPFGILFLATRASKNSKIQTLIFIATAGVIARGAFAYYQAYFVYLDAQSGLTFLFTPLEQILVSAIVLIVAVAENIRSHGNPA